MGKHIGYLDETFDEYGVAIDRAASIRDLREAVQKFRRFANDACKVVSKMDDEGWRAFKKGLRLERKGKFAGEDWAEKYGAVLMPEVMFRIGILAVKFHVPWGCAFLRAKQEGLIIERGGVVQIKKNQEAL